MPNSLSTNNDKEIFPPQKTIKSIIKIALSMFFSPSNSFDKILSISPIRKIQIILGIEVGIMTILGIIYLITKGSVPFSLSYIFIYLFVVIAATIIGIGLLVYLPWLVASALFAWIGRRLLGGKGTYEDLSSVVGLFLIAGFLIFVPICFFESIFLPESISISKFLSPPFTVFYLTIGLQRAHRISVLKALILLILFFIFLIIVGVPLCILYDLYESFKNSLR